MPLDKKTKIAIIFFLVFGCVAISSIFFSAPKDFPKNEIITVEKGRSVLAVGELLKSEHVIRSKTLFVIVSKMLGAERDIKSGDYYFKKPANLIKIAISLRDGTSDMERVLVTIPEGSTNKEIAQIFSGNKSLLGFNQQKFLEIAKDKEGYLFPDSYFFISSTGAEEIVAKLNQQFEKNILSLGEKISQGGHTLKEIITMASIVEKEVRSLEEKKIVAGILWKRIEKGMPLQVDATLHYLLDKTSEQLTLDDLKMDSPYNTYNRKGLPPGPIGNPGMDSIVATLEPAASPFYFYLTGNDGKTYFARTFEDHKKNKEKYLK
jgi:UPF0755 protein